jgi:uncharacterized repeat protein (TIGR02543 family)
MLNLSVFRCTLLLILISFLAVAGVACSGTGGNNDTGDPLLPGRITISPLNDYGGSTTGVELTAMYDGSEEVSYQWYKDGVLITAADGPKHRPDTAGDYTVVVRADGFQPKTSDVVEVDGPDVHVVTFHRNNTDAGSVDAVPQSLITSEGALPDYDPTRIGYTFAGWNTQPGGTGDVYNGDKVESSKVVYAQWTGNTYTVEYDVNGASGDIPDTTRTYNDNAALPASVREGYTFTGWNTAKDGSGTAYVAGYSGNLTAEQGDTITLFAQWAPITYIVQYNANGGTGNLPPAARSYGDNAALPASTRTGYVFIGWNTAANGTGASYSAGFTGNLTATQGAAIILYARWAANTYTVQYNANGASGSMADAPRTYDDNAALTANVFTLTGHTFTGWNTAANGSGTAYAAGYRGNLTAEQGATIVLYARWAPITYTVVYNANATSGITGTMALSTHTFGLSYNLSAIGFTRIGHTFDGWNTQADGLGEGYANSASILNLFDTPGGSITLFAQWTPVKYTVVYNANALGVVTGTMDSTEHTFGTPKNLTANSFRRADYFFIGWAASSAGDVVHTDGAEVLNLRNTAEATITLYARWFPIPMQAIPAGSFTMGSPTAIPESTGGERPTHQVAISGFRMGRYPVTQELYQAAMGSHPSFYRSGPIGGETQARRPVEQVSWFQAIVFCNMLSIRAGLTPVYSIGGETNPAEWGIAPDSATHINFAAWNAVVADWDANGYRLPTESEWEYACRMGTTTAFSCGKDDYTVGYDTLLNPLGWFGGNSGTDTASRRTRQVGLKTPNEWGLYDMHGNVLEWVWDWWAFYTTESKTNPRGPSAGEDRIQRGGSYAHAANWSRSAFRASGKPWDARSTVGFRIARNAP